MSSEARTVRGAPTYLAAYAALAVLTTVVAVMMVPFNIHIGHELANNPSDNAQLAFQWSVSAALGYTSGSAVGWALALVAGMLARRWAAPREMNGAAVALLPGACLGLVGLAAAAMAAVPRLREIAEANAAGMYEPRNIDPGLVHHSGVLFALIVALALYVGSSGVGYAAAGHAAAVGGWTSDVVAILLPPAYLVGGVIVRFGGAMAVAPGMFPS